MKVLQIWNQQTQSQFRGLFEQLFERLLVSTLLTNYTLIKVTEER